jgi:hypothetical protein
MHGSQIDDDVDTFEGKFASIKRLSGVDGDRLYKGKRQLPSDRNKHRQDLCDQDSRQSLLRKQMLGVRKFNLPTTTTRSSRNVGRVAYCEGS